MDLCKFFTNIIQCYYRYYEELSCDEVDAVILKRLESGEKPTLTYGKLMERILKFSGIECRLIYVY